MDKVFEPLFLWSVFILLVCQGSVVYTYLPAAFFLPEFTSGMSILFLQLSATLKCQQNSIYLWV